MNFGLTPQGFNTPRLAEIKTFLENDFIAIFGDINTDPQSVVGQIIGIFAKVFADLWENMEDVYFSEYPNSASGVSLDNVVQLNGLTRLPATQTQVQASCFGIEGTLIPQNAQARIDSTGEVFYARDGGVISRNNANFVSISSSNPPIAQAYTVIISGKTYTYSRPTIVFANSGDIFVPGNIITVYLNGVQLPSVPYNTSSNQTLTDIYDQILAFPTVDPSTSKTNPDSISIFSLLGFSTVVTNITITGGANQATYTINYTPPPSLNAISQRLVAMINQVDDGYTATDLTGGNFTISSNNAGDSYSFLVGNGMSIISQSSPILFLSTNFGPIPCPENTLTTIITPIAGWSSVNNVQAGELGRFVETDAQLRVRRAQSIKLLGSATVEAITAGIRQKVPGVISCTVFENVTLTQQDISISFPLAFTPGDVITVIYNTVNSFNVNYNTDQNTTMADLVTAFEALPFVSSASYGGTGNQVLTIEMNQSTVLTVNSVVVTGVTQTATITGGRPPKSFEAVVQGGNNVDIANQIWQTKPAGIETYGNVEQAIIDSQGNTQVIFFSRPSQIYIYVQVALTLYTEETFPSTGIQDVTLNIYEYGLNLGVGIDVLLQRVLSQIFKTNGIASGNMTIAAVTNLSDNPNYSTSDISIAENQISNFDPSRVFVTVI